MELSKSVKSRESLNIINIVFIPIFLLLIVFPTVSLVYNIKLQGIIDTFNDQDFWISVRNTMTAAGLAALLGMILAIGFGYYHLFKKNTFIYKVANLFNDLPVALPHTVAGLALLLAFGRKNFGFIGKTGLAFTMFAVVLAMFFVSYSLCARTVAAGVDQIDLEIVDVARTLGDSPIKAYFKVVLPGIREALFSGFLLAFSRSLSEFAAVIMFGGNIPRRTQSLASYVFTKVEEGELEMAITASIFCIFLSLVIVGVLSIQRSMKNVKN